MQNDQINTSIQNQNTTAPSTMGAGGYFEPAQPYATPTTTVSQLPNVPQNITNQPSTEINSLELPPETEQNIDQSDIPLPPPKKPKLNKPILAITAVSIVIVGLAAMLLGAYSSRQSTKLQSPSQSVGEQGVVLNDKTADALSVLQLKGSQNKLIVNGDLITLGRLAIKGGSYYGQFVENNLSANREYVLPDSSGTLCLDTNNCNFANSSNVVKSINGVGGSLSLGVGLSMQGSTIVNSQASTTVNGIDGNVVVQGTTNQINVSNSGGKVILSTPQDIAAASSPTFDGLTLTSTGTQNGNVLCDISNNCGYAGGGNYFTQNGNAFGTTATLGTTDNNNLVFETNGTDRVTIDTNGHVGIGTSLPAQTLDVAGTATISGHVNIGNVVNFPDALLTTPLQVIETDSSNGSLAAGALVAYIPSPTSAVTERDGVFTLLAAAGTGDITYLDGNYVDASYDGSATVSLLNGVNTKLTVYGGTVNQAAGIYVQSTQNSGTLTDNYGILIDPQTVGTNNYGIAVGAADTQTIWLSNNADNTTASAGIAFGSSRDTNLYRSAAGTLKTDNKFAVGTLGTTDTAAYLCLNSSSILAACSGTSTGSAFVQGGNSFGATAILGTNDSNPLTLVTNGSEVARLTTGGTLEVNSTGTPGTVEKIRVNTPTTVDNSANVIFSADAATSKALVVQGAASQSNDIFQVQTSDGTAQVKVNASGVLAVGPQGISSTSGTNNLNYITTNRISSTTSNVASTGVIRLGNTDTIAWRNAANSGDITTSVNASDIFQVTSPAADGSTVAQFNNAGATSCTVQPGGTGFACSSDARLKTNVVTIGNGLDIIRQLRGVNFNWISNPNGQTQSGFLAQELKDIIPDAVSKDSNGYYVANYQAIIPYLVGAAQQQDIQITGVQQTQTNTNATLDNINTQLGNLEQRVSALEASQPQGNNSNFGSLNVSGAASVQNLTVTGAATIAQLTVTGDAQIAGNLTVGGHVLGNSDTRGTITIPAGQTQFKFTFVKPYTAGSQPNVILTPKNTFAPSYRVDSTDKDFTVYFETPATTDVQMNYQVQE